MSSNTHFLRAYDKANRSKYTVSREGIVCNDDDGTTVLESYLASKEYNAIRSKGPLVSGVSNDNLNPNRTPLGSYDDILKAYGLAQEQQVEEATSQTEEFQENQMEDDGVFVGEGVW